MMVARDLAPMEAKLVVELPQEAGWQFEPKMAKMRPMPGLAPA